jgi:hypothetical protein
MLEIVFVGYRILDYVNNIPASFSSKPLKWKKEKLLLPVNSP